MAITSAICNSYKLESLRGVHLDTDTYKILLLKAGASGTYDKTFLNVGTPGAGAPTLSNVGTDEMVAVGYTSGGLVLTAGTWALNGDTASIDWADALWTPVTFSSPGAIIYNFTQGGKVLQVINFADSGPSPVNSTNGDFKIVIPSAGIGQIRWT